MVLIMYIASFFLVQGKKACLKVTGYTQTEMISPVSGKHSISQMLR